MNTRPESEIIWVLLNDIGIGLKVTNLIKGRSMRRKILVGEDMTSTFDVANELRECFAVASFLFFLFLFSSCVLWL